MAWFRLDLNTHNRAPVDLYPEIVNDMTKRGRGDLWIVQVYEGVPSHASGNFFTTYQDLCRGIWTEWPLGRLNTFIDSYRLGEICPIIFSQYQPNWYFVVKDFDIAEKILATQIDLIKEGKK